MLGESAGAEWSASASIPFNGPPGLRARPAGILTGMSPDERLAELGLKLPAIAPLPGGRQPRLEWVLVHGIEVEAVVALR